MLFTGLSLLVVNLDRIFFDLVLCTHICIYAYRHTESHTVKEKGIKTESQRDSVAMRETDTVDINLDEYMKLFLSLML